MADGSDGIPDYMEEEINSRIAARGNESTLIVNESEEEVIVSYTGFTKSLKREYKNACEEWDEDTIKVYHLTKEGWAIQLVRYDSAKGINGEVVWREKVR